MLTLTVAATKTTRALKLLAIKLNVVIVIASQLSRAIEKR